MPTNTSRRPATGRRPSAGSGRTGQSFNRSARPQSGGDRSGGRSRFHGGNSRSGARSGGRSGGGGGRKQPTFDPSQFINKNPVQVEEIAYSPKTQVLRLWATQRHRRHRS